MTVSTTPQLDMGLLQRRMLRIAGDVAPATVGLGLTNLESGEHWAFNSERRFPMQSVFKAALGAAVLTEMEAGRLKGDEAFVIDDHQLSPPWSPIADAGPARRDYTADQLLVAAVSDSDNTASDVLMKWIGGPGAVTAWLDARRVEGIRADRYERELQLESHAMASFRPNWKGQAAFQAARDLVPEPTRRAAMLRYMEDPRDTATPRGMVDFLGKLYDGLLLGPPATRRLLQIMAATPRGADRLKAGFPPGSVFSHKPGTSGSDLGLTAAYNDVGIVVFPDKRAYAVAAFLSGSVAAPATHAPLMARLGRLVTEAVG